MPVLILSNAFQVLPMTWRTSNSNAAERFEASNSALSKADRRCSETRATARTSAVRVKMALNAQTRLLSIRPERKSPSTVAEAGGEEAWGRAAALRRPAGRKSILRQNMAVNRPVIDVATGNWSYTFKYNAKVHKGLISRARPLP